MEEPRIKTLSISSWSQVLGLLCGYSVEPAWVYACHCWDFFRLEAQGELQYRLDFFVFDTLSFTYQPPAAI